MQDFNIYEVVGWVALALNIWGNLALTKKSSVGWLIRLLCNIAWIIYSFTFSVYPLLANHFIFSFINLYGWVQWNKTIHTCSCGRKIDLEKHKGNCICEAILPRLSRPTGEVTP